MQPETHKDFVRLAAVGDLHCAKSSRGTLAPLFTQMAESADYILLCGDLTDTGLPEEANILIEELKAAGSKVPVLAVLGNHDFESDKQDQVKEIFAAAGIIMLDGDHRELSGVGFTGIKGFLGGFGRHSLQTWGEPSLKQLV